jgi:mannose-1-phosphate guanylyltransferase/phosphomannomutase
VILKGVIMAGGKGTRLRPLTCNVPKPMVPMLHKPVMEYGIDLLKRHGITDIAVTVHYLPEVIKNYFGDGSEFGVNLHYFEETSPLGTAGSIKNAEAFLDERFVVISGDALTDFDLLKGVQFHEEKGSLISIFMKQVDSPLEYGVIMTNQDGEIIRFLEKPSWNEVFSDTVNTGIYVLEPEVFSYLEEGVPTDFSKDLFPLLMKEGKPLYGYSAEGYWSDIGSLNQYRQSHYDMLDGIVNLPSKGKEVKPGIWVGNNVKIENGALLEAPLSIDDDAVIRKGAKILPYSVIGKNNVISSNSSLKKSILWHDVYLDDNCELRGATIANSTHLQKSASVYEHAVIGDHCKIGYKVNIKPEVKVWPDKGITDEAKVHTSLIWGKKATKSLFGSRGISGLANIEITPDYIARLASAYGAILPQGAKIYVGSDYHRFSELIKQSFIQGLHSSGVNTYDLSPSLAPVVRYMIEQDGCSGGIFVRFANERGEKQVNIDFYDNNGLPIHPDLERKIENAYWQEDYRRAAFDMIGTGRHIAYKTEDYIQAVLKQVSVESINNANYRIVMNTNQHMIGLSFSKLFEQLNCELLTVPYFTTQEEMASFVKYSNADVGFLIDASGEKLRLVTDKGNVIDEETLLSLYVLITFGHYKINKLAVPVYGASELDLFAKQLDGQLIRTKANPRSILQVGNTVLNLQYDALFAFASILDFMATNTNCLSDLTQLLPYAKLFREQVACPKDVKGKVMRRLMEEIRNQEVDLVDGIKVYHPEGGWTLILPDVEHPKFTVYSQATNLDKAKEVSKHYISKIREFQKV